MIWYRGFCRKRVLDLYDRDVDIYSVVDIENLRFIFMCVFVLNKWGRFLFLFLLIVLIRLVGGDRRYLWKCVFSKDGVEVRDGCC